MRDRTAGQAVIAEFLREQALVPPRTAVARLFGRSPLSTESRPWYIGAEGEIAVGRELARLKDGWVVFHAVPVGTKGSDIDHVVVGPGGVFTINTKHHSGKNIWVAGRTFMVSGQKQPHIRNAEYEATRVTKLIRERMPLVAPVHPVVAIVDPKQITIREKPEVVVVLNAGRLRRWLEKRLQVLSLPEVAALVTLLDNPDVWGVASDSHLDRDAEFSRLDREVRSARTRRKLWAGVGTLGLIGMLIGAGPIVVDLYVALITSLLP